MTTDRLLRSAARGNADALTELIRDRATDVHRFLVGMLGDAREAEDAVQETFVRVARSAGRFEADDDADAWLYGIARRVAVDRRPTPSVFDSSEVTDAETWATRALRALPAEHRELVVGREIMGWDDEMLARVLEIPATEVQERLCQAREALLAQGGVEALR